MTETDVPRGPGAVVPFPAAPTEGSGSRIGWGIGAAGVVLVLCLGGGFAALIGLVVTGVAAINEQARAQVGSYLDEVRDGKYDKAYARLCDAEQKALSKERFAQQQRDKRKITSYELGEIDPTAGDIRLPVTEKYADGSTDSAEYVLVQDQSTGVLEVCGRD